MIVTRLATSNDAEEVQTVTDAAFATVRELYRPKPNAIPTSENANLCKKTIVALVNGKIVGATCVYRNVAALHVSQLAVVPKFRKRGVARALLQGAVELGIESGAIEVVLNTIQETGNVAIFQRLGFTIQATSEATWCISDRFPILTEITMTRKCIEEECS